MDYILAMSKKEEERKSLTKLHKSLTDDNYLTHIILSTQKNISEEQKKYHIDRAEELIKN